MVEQKITDLDIALKMALHHEKPDLKRCLTISDEVQKLAIVPLMLKKHPEIVATIRRMRKYVGPREPHPNPKVKFYQKTWTFDKHEHFLDPLTGFIVGICPLIRARQTKMKLLRFCYIHD